MHELITSLSFLSSFAYPAVLISKHILPHNFPRYSPLSLSPPLLCLPPLTQPLVLDWWNVKGGPSLGVKILRSPQTLLIMRVLCLTWKTMTCSPGEPWPSSAIWTWPWQKRNFLSDVVSAHRIRNLTSSPSNTGTGSLTTESSLISRWMMWFIGRRRHSSLSCSDHSLEPLTTMPLSPSQNRGPCLLISRPDCCAPHVLWPRAQQQVTRIRLRKSHTDQQTTCSSGNLEIVLRSARGLWQARQPII